MAVAFEEDSYGRVDEEKNVDYMINAHDHLYKAAFFKKRFEFPFYCQIVLGKFSFFCIKLRLHILLFTYLKFYLIVIFRIRSCHCKN